MKAKTKNITVTFCKIPRKEQFYGDCQQLQNNQRRKRPIYEIRIDTKFKHFKTFALLMHEFTHWGLHICKLRANNTEEVARKIEEYSYNLLKTMWNEGLLKKGKNKL